MYGGSHAGLAVRGFDGSGAGVDVGGGGRNPTAGRVAVGGLSGAAEVGGPEETGVHGAGGGGSVADAIVRAMGAVGAGRSVADAADAADAVPGDATDASVGRGELV